MTGEPPGSSGLWSGAVVRWVGPDIERQGVRVREGDRAVVVDTGRHRIGSMGMASGGLAAPREGVLIRLETGRRIEVDREGLELVAPDHPLSPEPDPRVARWWSDELDRPRSLPPPIGGLVPRSLPAACRVLHPWRTPHGEPVRWSTVAEELGVGDRVELAERCIAGWFGSEGRFDAGDYRDPPIGRLDQHTAEALVSTLAPATTTPAEVFFAVWTGWGDIPPQQFPQAARVTTPRREHFLLRGPLEGALESIAAGRRRDQPVPGSWWPADRAWFLATGIDYPWTFVAGDESLVEQLHDCGALETVRTTREAPASPLER